MKLDRFKFAQLAAWIGKKSKKELTQEDIGHLDWLTEMPDPLPTIHYASAEDVNAMLNYMAADRKIEAIKLHRSMTGFGLKESKDVIETVMDKMKN